MDQHSHLDSTFGSPIVTSRLRRLNHTLFLQVRCFFHQHDYCRSVSRTTRLTLCYFDSPFFRTGYTEVVAQRAPSLPFRSHDDRIVSCAQIFYYFQHYSKKDGRGTKAVVRPGEFLSVGQVLTSDRLLRP